MNITYTETVKHYPLTNEHKGSTFSTKIEGTYLLQPKTQTTINLPFKTDIPTNHHITAHTPGYNNKITATFKRKIIQNEPSHNGRSSAKH